MLVDRDDYVIINIWASKTDKAISGAHGGRVSLSTKDRYISFGPTFQKSLNPSVSYLQKPNQKPESFKVFPLDYQDNYERDCLNEAYYRSGYYALALMPENGFIKKNTLYVELLSNNSLRYTVIAPSKQIVIGIIDEAQLKSVQQGLLADLTNPSNNKLSRLQEILPNILQITTKRGHTQEVLFRPLPHGSELAKDETVYRFDSTTTYYEPWRTALPAETEDKYSFWAVKTIPAQFRMVLYSLSALQVENEFERFLRQGISGWFLAGSNKLSQYFLPSGIQSRYDETAYSLVHRCLIAGGLPKEDNSPLVIGVDTLEDLLIRLVAAKENELQKYPETACWKANGLDDTLEKLSVTLLRDSYKELTWYQRLFFPRSLGKALDNLPKHIQSNDLLPIYQLFFANAFSLLWRFQRWLFSSLQRFAPLDSQPYYFKKHTRMDALYVAHQRGLLKGELAEENFRAIISSHVKGSRMVNALVKLRTAQLLTSKNIAILATDEHQSSWFFVALNHLWDMNLLSGEYAQANFNALAADIDLSFLVCKKGRITQEDFNELVSISKAGKGELLTAISSESGGEKLSASIPIIPLNRTSSQFGFFGRGQESNQQNLEKLPDELDNTISSASQAPSFA